MAAGEAREKLTLQLELLRKNIAAVSREVLRTRYKVPYEKLVRDICAAATEYVTLVALQGIYIRREYIPEVKKTVESACKESGLLKRISKAAFAHQDIKEIDALALALREQVFGAMERLYARHRGFYLAEECFANPPRPPFLYDAITDSILVNNVWKPLWRTAVAE